ncbi:hypothetical protein G4Y79_22250 [Phototrophicus methaneseepsis]|uniref:Uncharacterized protein n=1 Tax=Phototrophicus methaneseepsis TaxID=2710758 RepID=A0A7S8E8S6_9CHLR|nr:hypothetical protein [Phototrophicus methaneseepsis]QPC82373.1 hypothetical protein G4Y79_22250 [Phototrophicus methaneseepsis]
MMGHVMRKQRSLYTMLMLLMVACIVAACDAMSTESTVPTPTLEHERILATAYISPTPNVEQVRATQLAITPTVAVPTATIQPTQTPFVGVFIGEAERDDSSVNVAEPFFAPDINVFIEPTANANRCGVPVDNAYLDAWRTSSDVNTELGCPIQAALGFFGTVQVFENGIMYRRDETREIWAITIDGDRGLYSYVEAPPQVVIQGQTAPPGLLPPEGDFAVVWLNVPGLRERMGYARTEALSDVALGTQRFTTGTFFLDGNAGQSYALTNDGRVFGPFAVPDASAEGTPTVTGMPGEGVQVISTSTGP